MYVVSYDISETKRRNKIENILSKTKKMTFITII